ncbi:hypothetical protein NXS19_009523 [Fusarium pseudograminearum]|nr:hypothetical protein NXS19_009523 [Fusarium pseudograminearum]
MDKGIMAVSFVKHNSPINNSRCHCPLTPFPDLVPSGFGLAQPQNRGLHFSLLGKHHTHCTITYDNLVINTTCNLYFPTVSAE